MEVARCLERKDGVKMVIVRKKSEIKKDDLVLMTNDLKLIKKFKEAEDGKK